MPHTSYRSGGRDLNPLRPKLETWQGSSAGVLKAALEQYKKEKELTDTKICEQHGLSRPQFSRVMNGHEVPTTKILGVLETLLPDEFAEEIRKWKKGPGIITEAEKFREQLENAVRSTGGYPGVSYVLAARDFWFGESDVLVSYVADYLQEHENNRIEYIFSDSIYTYKQRARYGINHFGHWNPSPGGAFDRYISRIAEFSFQNLTIEKFLEQVQVSEISLLPEIASVNPSGSNDSCKAFLAEIAAAQVFSPFMVWMIYQKCEDEQGRTERDNTGYGFRHTGFFFVRSDIQDFAWFPLAPEDTENLLWFISAIKKLQSTSNLVNKVDLTTLSTKFKLMQSNIEIK